MLSFEDACRSGEAVAGDVRGEQAVGRRFGGMELFGVGGVAQELPETGRLCPGRPEGVEHGLSVGAEQAGDRGCGSQRACGPGGVKGMVMGAAEVGTDPDSGLVARHCGDQQVPARSPGLLRGGECCGEHHGRRMEDRPVVNVVLLHHVRRSPVYQRGEEGRDTPARDQDLTGTIGRSHDLRETL